MSNWKIFCFCAVISVSQNIRKSCCPERISPEVIKKKTLFHPKFSHIGIFRISLHLHSFNFSVHPLIKLKASLFPSQCQSKSFLFSLKVHIVTHTQLLDIQSYSFCRETLRFRVWKMDKWSLLSEATVSGFEHHVSHEAPRPSSCHPHSFLRTPLV